MYSVSNTIKSLLSRPYRQIVRITFNNGQGSTVLTESNVEQNSFSIDRYSCSNNKLEVGSAIASELTFQLKNRDGAFNNTVFEGAELFVQVGIKNWDSASSTTYWIPCGYFTVDKPPRKLSTISISALDRMMKFNRDVDSTQLTFPMTVETLVNRCCTLCGVTLASGQFSGLPNRSYLISKLPESQEALTYRTLIQWAVQIMGVCAFMDWDGKLRLQWYKTADYTVTSSMRYTSDMLEQDIALSGVVFTDTDKVEYLAGTDSYAVDLTGNLLIQDSPQTVVNNLWNVLNGFSYRPYTAAVKPAPYLYPMDKITFVDKDGVSHSTIVTNVNYKLNGKTLIAGTGETEQTNGYATDGGLTAKQAAILERMKRQTDEVIASREQATLDLNEIIVNAMGLYRTLVPDGSGGTYIYYHDAPTLDDSNVIYTLTAGGFATTDDWNDGNPTWNYGMSRDGNAVINALSAYKVTADLIAVEYTDDVLSQASTATDNKLSNYSTTEQMNTAISLSAQGISASIAQTYETKSEAATLLTTAQTYADNAASDAEAAAKADTTTKLQSYYTKTQTDSAISQSAQDILLSVSSTYATQTVVAEVRNATITSDQLHYLATSASSGVTTSTSGWTTTPQSVTATKKYLWTYHTYTYGDNTTRNTSPVITGVYGDQGQTGPAGGTGPQGPTGTSISEVVPLYYASSSSSAPSAPTSNVTRTSTVAGYWTRSLPAVSTSYPYLYTCDQVKYSDNTYAWTTVVKDNAICDLSTRMNSAELKITDSAIISTVTNTTAGQNAVNSLIEQKAYSIRLQASTIAWDSQYSSMTADGKLECQEAKVNGSLYSGKSNGYYVNINDGIISGGKTDVIGYDNFISFQGVFGYGDGPYLKGDNITFEGDIKVIDSYTIYTGYSGAVKIPTSIRSDGTVATWLNMSFINGLLVQ